MPTLERGIWFPNMRFIFGRHVNTRPHPAVCHNSSPKGGNDCEPKTFTGAEHRNRSVVPIILREQHHSFNVHETIKSYDLDPRPLTNAIFVERRKGRKSYPPSFRNIVDAEQLKGLPVRLEYQQMDPSSTNERGTGYLDQHTRICTLGRKREDKRKQSRTLAASRPRIRAYDANPRIA